MQIVVLPGDDIGPEIVGATVTVLRQASDVFSLDLQFETRAVGWDALRESGTTLPEPVIEACKASHGVIMGPAATTEYPPESEGGINVPGIVRKRLDLFANIRPTRSRPGIDKALPGLDCVIVRENNQGFYASRNMFKGNGEFMPTPDVAMAVRNITREQCNRLTRTACKIAASRKKKLWIIAKPQVLKLSDGLFVEEAEKVVKEFPGLECQEIHVDAFAADVYLHPERFDVAVTTNMFGDILSDLTGALSGGLGLAGGLNAGEDHAAANAAHGSAPDIAGQGIANPTSMILSATALLNWMATRHQKPALAEAATAIETAIDASLADPEGRTRDLGGKGTTDSFAQLIANKLKKK